MGRGWEAARWRCWCWQGFRATSSPPSLLLSPCPPAGGILPKPSASRGFAKMPPLPSPPLPAPPSGSAPQRPNTSGFHGSLIFNEHRSSPNRNESVSLMRAGHAGISPGRQQLPPKLAPSARGGFFVLLLLFSPFGPRQRPMLCRSSALQPGAQPPRAPPARLHVDF